MASDSVGDLHLVCSLTMEVLMASAAEADFSFPAFAVAANVFHRAIAFM